MFASQVHANLYGEGLAKGEGTLHVQAHLLRPLEGRGTLFAMVSMDLDQRSSAIFAPSGS